MKAAQRLVCLHGHFYQPPRENPWLQSIEVQDSAFPYHDWNERITAECYEPNAYARILDSEGYIVSIVSNYERISFNFGRRCCRGGRSAARVYERSCCSRQAEPGCAFRGTARRWPRAITTRSCRCVTHATR
jgi:hypothetical protein